MGTGTKTDRGNMLGGKTQFIFAHERKKHIGPSTTKYKNNSDSDKNMFVAPT